MIIPHGTALHTARGLRNSEIRFGIGISETEPYRTELFLEFRKIGIPEFRLFQISEFLTFYGICFQDEMSLVSATFGLWTLVCLLLITSFLLLVFSYVVISEFQHVSLHKWRIRTLIPNRFRTVPRNLLNSVPNRFRTIFWHSVPNRTELWKSIPQTPTINRTVSMVPSTWLIELQYEVMNYE